MKTLLIVEDSAEIRQRIRASVEATVGIEIIGEAADAEAAIRFIEEQQPDFLTLDLHLAGNSNGLDVLEFLKERAQPPRVIVLSAHVDRHALQRHLIDSANHVLDKATDFHHLATILSMAISSEDDKRSAPGGDKST